MYRDLNKSDREMNDGEVPSKRANVEAEMQHIPVDKCDCPSNVEQSAPTAKTPTRRKVTKRAIVTSLVLFYINLLNYMDRSTVSGVLPDIQLYFKIGDSKAGLLITVFVCSYVVFAPLFGYLGDRYSRKYLMVVGIIVWSITTFAGSQLKSTQYPGFLALRGLVGIGEASFSIVAPTLIADLFVGDHRTKALTLFNFAMPCGSGLGYICGSQTAAAMKNWKWALRLTPALGVIAVIFTLIFLKEPTRGDVERRASNPELEERAVAESHSYVADIKKILKVKSFVWSTLGFTCVSFASGALACWAPAFILYAEQVYDKSRKRTIDEVSYIFGIDVILAGVAGNLVGAELARKWRVTNMKADALVCGIGVSVATPCLFFALWTADKNFILSWVIMFFGSVFMFFSWTPTADMLLYVIPPNCRATAEAIQVLMIHIFGDAFSPLIIGAISDAYINDQRDVEIMHLGLLYSFYTTLVVLCCGAACYFVNAFYLIADKRNVEMMSANDSVYFSQAVALDNLPPRESNVLVPRDDEAGASFVNQCFANDPI